MEASPSKKVAELVIKAVEVRLFLMFKNNFSTPVSKLFISCCSALKPFTTLTPFKVSVNRPVTSAFIFPRSLKIGRINPKAFIATNPNIATGTST